MKISSIIIASVFAIAVILSGVACYFNGITAEPVTAEDLSFTLMNFNVRVDNISESGMKVPYDTVTKRTDLMLKHIADADPDIICIQEWQYPHNGGKLWKALKETYNKVGEQRAKGLNEESNPVLYKKDRFELVETETFWLTDTPNIAPEKDEETGLYPFDSAYPRICTTAVLIDKKSGKTIRVSSTHLDLSVKANGKQRKIVVDYTAQSEYPAIISGDFNFDATHANYLYCINTLNDCRTACLNSKTTASYNNYGLKDSSDFSVVDANGNIKDGYGYPIDQIFVKRNSFTVHSYDVLNYLIDGKFSSDHFPVLVRLSVNI